MLPTLANSCLLVTGGAGFMGSNFIRYLLAQESFQGKVLNLDLLTYAADLDNLASVQNDPRYLFIKGDIQNQHLLQKLHQEYFIDIIVHFAAETHVDRSIDAPRAFIETNVLGTTQLLEFVRGHPEIHFHHISTDEVYGSLGETGVFTESSPYEPNSPYSASKAASDHFVLAYGKTYGLSVTLSHACNNYGPYQFPEKFIPLMIINCIGKKPLPVYGDGKNQRDWLYVDDHSRAIEKILTRGENRQIYNVGSGQECTNIDLLGLIIRVIAAVEGKAPTAYCDLITFISDRPGHDFRYALATEKIAGLGWEPHVKLEEGIKRSIEWYYSHSDWVKRIQSKEYHEWLQRQYPEAFAQEEVK